MKPRRPEMARFLALFATIGGFAFPGCGGDEEPAGTQSTSPPVGRAPSATAPPAGAPSRTVKGRPERPPGGRRVPGGEQPVRVRAAFTLREGRFYPSTVTVPPFLAVRVSVAATDGQAHSVTIEAGRTYQLRVPAGKRASVTIDGQPPGRYPVRAGEARATLAVEAATGS